MKSFTLLTISSLLILSSIGMFQEASASSNKICENEIIATGIFKNIKVVDGNSCTITGDTIIEKNLIVNGANDVIVDSSTPITIGGNIKIENSLGTILINNAEINGNVKLLNNLENDILINSNKIGKNLILKTNTVDDVFDTPSYLKIHIRENTIQGNVVLIDNVTDDDILLHSNTIGGDTILRDNTVQQNDILLYSNIVSGNVQLIKNNAFSLIDVVENTILGNVNLKANIVSDEYFIENNTIEGRLLFSHHENALVDFQFGNNLIGHDLKIIKNSLNRITVYSNDVKNNIVIQKNHSNSQFILENTSHEKFSIIKNTVNSDYTGSIGIYFNGNTSFDKIVIGKNVIESDLLCSDNTPKPIGKKNIVSGSKSDQCSDL